MSTLILIGALIHAPTNYDGLTYRIPRLCHWLQANHWHWINGVDYRMNIAGSGFEWLSAPLVLASRSDRLLFLLNYIPFLLLPALFFIAGCGLGVRARTARWWMWAWPLAYGVALQAGSIGNDLVILAFSLIALAFAAQAKKSHPASCLFMSALAAVVMSGIKHSAIPLLLPIGIYWLAQAWALLDAKRTISLGLNLIPVGLLCGLLPLSYLCWQQTGRWNGNPNNQTLQEAPNAIAGLAGNGLNFIVGCAYPPLLPKAKTVGEHANNLLMTHDNWKWVHANYDYAELEIGHEIPTEETAGLGLALSFLVLLWAFASFRQRPLTHSHLTSKAVLFAVGSVVALLSLLTKLGVGGVPRLVMPLTPILLLSVLAILPAVKRLPKQAWACMAALSILPSIALNPNRPLVSSSLLKTIPGVPASITQRMDTVYSTYACRNDLLRDLKPLIPTGAAVAFGGNGDHPASSLFFPLNRWKISQLNPTTDTQAEWVIGTQAGIERRMDCSMHAWSNQRYEVVQQRNIVSKVGIGAESWFLFKRIQ